MAERETVTLPDGTRVPALGQGTWRMGEDASQRAREVAALRLGLDLGLGLIDTAEMYGDGAAEEIVGEAIAGRRDEVFLVSKVYPHNATRAGMRAACARSLKRLRVERIDLYLLHWRGEAPMEETLAGFRELLAAGKIARWGVSNFDRSDMEELWALDGGEACATNQVLYNIAERGPEYDLFPALAEHGVPAMAYSPVAQGRLPKALSAIAEKHGASRHRVALAFVLSRGDVLAIPKASSPEHVRDNAAARHLVLDDDDLATLDRLFPPPRGPVPLAMN